MMKKIIVMILSLVFGVFLTFFGKENIRVAEKSADTGSVMNVEKKEGEGKWKEKKEGMKEINNNFSNNLEGARKEAMMVKKEIRKARKETKESKKDIKGKE
jgi:predicted secreted protein